MSKKIPAQIKCPACNQAFNTELYRTIWIEYPENRDLIFKNLINSVKCPKCGVTTKLEFPFLCTNVKREIAVWYEPYPDPEIDKDIAQYETHMGKNSFYARAPRIRDWEEFKSTIVEKESRGKISSNENLIELIKAMTPEDLQHLSLAAQRFALDSGPADKKHVRLIFSKFITSLLTVKGRLLYSLIPYFAFIILLNMEQSSGLHFIDIILSVIVVYVPSFVTLSVIITVIFNWKARKDIRVFCFTSVLWMIGIFIYSVISGFYGYDLNWSEFSQILMFMFCPPVFIFSAKYIYERYIK